MRSGVAQTFHCPHKHTSLPQIMCMLGVLVLVSNPFTYGKRRDIPWVGSELNGFITTFCLVLIG